MNFTEKLKGWLIEHMQVAETASDEEFREALDKAIQEKKLPLEQLYELMTPENEDMAKAIASAVTEGVKPMAERVEQLATDVEQLKQEPKDDERVAELTKQVETLKEKARTRTDEQPKDSQVSPSQLFGDAGTDGASTPRVKAVTEMYEHTRKSLYYPSGHRWFADKPAMYGVDHASIGDLALPLPRGCTPMAPHHLESPSEFDLACCAAYFKKAVIANNGGERRLPRWLRMTEHDEQLWQWLIHDGKWTGIVGRGSNDAIDESPDSRNVVHDRKLTDWQRKALLDDSTSDGLEAAPIVFDAAVITTPVLSGELFPLVSVVPITRGRRIEGFAISNPSFTSGTAEGTAISLYNTDSMVTAFDTNIYNAVGAIEIGQDFEQDSPVNMGALIVQLYGEKAKEWLDNQLANGDGSTEIQGVFNASGITDIGNPSGGANAAPQPDDYITLWGNVAKQYRPKSDRARCVFIANDTSYQRARSIAVSDSDERRVFGMNIGDYELFQHPYKVQNDIANTVCGFFAMKYYRLYRRLGLTVRVETGGKELARKNLTLIVVRMRWGGKLELGGAGSYSDNWQT